MLIQYSIQEYAAKLASKEPTPGGGSAAALSGLLGAALLAMSIRLTYDKETSQDQQAFLSQAESELGNLQDALSGLVDRDAQAFHGVIQALALPKTSLDQQKSRDAAIQAAMRRAAEVPLETARASLRVLEIGSRLVGRIHAQVVSDLLVGALHAHTGVQGALLNTAINIPYLKDARLISALEEDIRQLRKAADKTIQDIQNAVYQQKTFYIMKAE